MQAASARFTAMIEGRERVLDYRVQLLLPVAASQFNDVTVALSAVQVQGSTVSDVPAGVRVDTGYPSTQAQFTLSGRVDPADETKTAAWLFGRYSRTSPLYRGDAFRIPVLIDVRLYPDGPGGPEPIRLFTGYVDEYVESTGGQVQFTCVDRDSDLHALPTLVPVVNAPPFNAGMTSEYVVNAIVRAATNGLVSTWPPPRPSCVLSVGFRSSTWPEVGALDVSTPQPGAQFGPGRTGTGLMVATAAGVDAGSVPYLLSDAVTTRLWVECGYVPDGQVTLLCGGITESVQVAITDGQVQILMQPPSGSPTVWSWAHGLRGPVYVGVGLTLPAVGATGWSAQIVVSNSATVVDPGDEVKLVHSTGPQTLAAARAQAWTRGRVLLVGGSAVVDGVQFSTETSPQDNMAWTPLAHIGPSLNPLVVIPALTGQAREIIQQLASAELAVAGWDEHGAFWWRNRRQLAAAPLARTLTSSDAIRDLSVRSSSAVINRARVGYTPWSFAPTASTVWSLDAITLVRAGQSVTLTADLADGYAVDVDTTVAELPDGSVDIAHSFFRASADGNGVTRHPGGLVFTIAPTPGRITITIANKARVDAYLVSSSAYTDLPPGTPLLRLAGRTVTQGSEQVAEWQFPPVSAGGAQSSRFGEQPYELLGNTLIQSPRTARQLCMDIVCEGCEPIPEITSLSIEPDPRIQLAERLRLVDTHRTGVDAHVFVYGSTLDYQSGGADGADTWEHTLDARAVSGPGAWLLGVAGSSELGDTTWL